VTYEVLDVFTAHPGGGNPLAVLPDAPALGDAEMQTIARRIGLSETVFVRPPRHPDALRSLRIFTPDMELPFAGHPTIGTAQLLVELGVAPRADPGVPIRFALEENVGLVAVEVVPQADGGFFSWLTVARLPERGPAPPPTVTLAALLGLSQADILDNTVDGPRAYSAGVGFLYVPVRDADALSRARVDVDVWKASIADFWAPHVYVMTTPADGSVAGRMFAPAMGIVEDPATGAAAAALAGYLWERDGVPGRWIIRQGVHISRPSELHVELTASGNALTQVRVGGAAVRIGQRTTDAGDSGDPRTDDRQLESMVTAYAGVIASAVRRVAGARAAGIGDDVQQAVVVGLWRQLQRGQTIERPASYLFRAAIRETIRLVKREPASASVVDAEEAPLASPSGDPHRRLEERQRQAAILAAIASLEAKRQQAVRAHLAGFDVREIMEMFGWSYQTARHLVARGMTDLRRTLRQRGIHD
jgi:trans-2,3-dihydro-3-hydroxyanthranilate isomerase